MAAGWECFHCKQWIAKRAALLQLDERMMARIWPRRPGGMLETPAPGQLSHLGISHVVMNVRQPFCFRIARPDALWTAEVGDA